jgi:hypothetical protein
LTDLQRILECVRRIEATQEEILARLDAGPSRLSHADHLLLGTLLPALAGRYGSGVFTTKDLVTDPVFKVLLDHASTQIVGNLLGKAVNVEISGLCIQRAKSDHNAVRWYIAALAPRLPAAISLNPKS